MIGSATGVILIICGVILMLICLSIDKISTMSGLLIVALSMIIIGGKMIDTAY